MLRIIGISLLLDLNKNKQKNQPPDLFCSKELSFWVAIWFFHNSTRTHMNQEPLRYLSVRKGLMNSASRSICSRELSFRVAIWLFSQFDQNVLESGSSKIFVCVNLPKHDLNMLSKVEVIFLQTGHITHFSSGVPSVLGCLFVFTVRLSAFLTIRACEMVRFPRFWTVTWFEYSLNISQICLRKFSGAPPDEL